MFDRMTPGEISTIATLPETVIHVDTDVRSACLKRDGQSAASSPLSHSAVLTGSTKDEVLAAMIVVADNTAMAMPESALQKIIAIDLAKLKPK